MYRLVFSFCLFCLWMLPLSAQFSSNGLEAQIRDYLRTKRAQVGVAVIINGKDTVSVNNEARYPLMSVFKFHQALAVADCLQRKSLPLTVTIHIGK